MSWSADQQTLLGAMGYVLYRQAGPGAEPVATQAGADTPLPEGRLLQALRRAARREDLSGLGVPPYERLRADAGAKRALWARLRAARRLR
ncbi:hypothetical protein [Arenimonas donghaensis]|uniref:Uncharacterized protein n=1 Tax=Arenimonas donghaensis DSM 18148 = HO3-R19 TaxID=1121014 RepID=A0A087MFR2_9GAMM|nr:hypothetical protein [Arenimonas donghaensis]KFL35715.1 hypothetical protein N788_07310 [Arenimonas donghaensis DSM 18148 = HO3-R19]